jgi:hypothetical protein
MPLLPIGKRAGNRNLHTSAGGEQRESLFWGVLSKVSQKNGQIKPVHRSPFGSFSATIGWGVVHQKMEKMLSRCCAREKRLQAYEDTTRLLILAV